MRVARLSHSFINKWGKCIVGLVSEWSQHKIALQNWTLSGRRAYSHESHHWTWTWESIRDSTSETTWWASKASFKSLRKLVKDTSQAPISSWEAPDTWWLQGEGGSVFFWCIVSGRLTMLQWIAPQMCAYRNTNWTLLEIKIFLEKCCNYNIKNKNK